MEIQQKFEKLIVSGENLDYDSIINPLCEELKSSLDADISKWPLIYIQDRVVIYYELLYKNRDRLDDKHLLLLMPYRPLIYYYQIMKLTYEEATSWRKKIKQLIPEVFGVGFSGERLIRFKELMKLSKKKLDVSPITFFHYFIGFKFSNKYIGLTKDELQTVIEGKNIIYININCKNKKDVYSYRQVTEAMGRKLLTLEVAKNFHPIIIASLKDDYPKEMITGNTEDENYVAINYDNEHFTLISDGDELKTYTKDETNRFINGALPITINDEDFEIYAKLMYHNTIPKIVTPINIEAKLPDAAKIYNERIRNMIDSYLPMNQNKYRQFVKEVESSITTEDMNENEKKLFIFYLDTYTFLEFNVYEFVSYLWGYFDPSLLL